jgi:phosphatidylethanolamine-binding protein (PEBP) family uncharacterized protein
MPAAYRGKDALFPPLRWAEVPSETRELVLVAEDVDVPFPQPLVHAIVYGISPERRSLAAGEIPALAFGGAAHVGDLGLGKAAGIAPGYLPPTPIPGHGPSKKELLRAMAGRVIARGATIGLAEG